MLTEDQVTKLAVSSPFIAKLGELRVNCPECDDTKGHMYINTRKGVYVCHKCGAKGKIQKSINSVEDFGRAVGSLFDVKYYPEWSEEQDKVIVERKEVRNLPLNSLPAYLDEPAWKYLSKRGLSDKEIIENCRFSSEKSGPYKDTVIFPIYRTGVVPSGQLQYFVCRRYTDQQPKYINAPWPKNDTLFIEKRKSNRYITGVIVEGIFDALAVARVGCMGISILGKSVTSGQLLRLKKLCDAYVIYLDDDAFTHGIKLKLQLDAIGKPSVLIHHNKDASDQWQSNPNELRKMLYGGIDAITEYPKSKV